MILQPTIIGEKLPTLTNPGSAADLLAGKQLIDADGNILTGTMPTQGAQTITPGTAAKTIAAGRYLTGAQTIQGDADLIAANIKSGVNIFGVTGTFVGGVISNLLGVRSKYDGTVSYDKTTLTFDSTALGSTIDTESVKFISIYVTGSPAISNFDVSDYIHLTYIRNTAGGYTNTMLYLDSGDKLTYNMTDVPSYYADIRTNSLTVYRPATFLYFSTNASYRCDIFY